MARTMHRTHWIEESCLITDRPAEVFGILAYRFEQDGKIVLRDGGPKGNALVEYAFPKGDSDTQGYRVKFPNGIYVELHNARVSVDYAHL